MPSRFVTKMGWTPVYIGLVRFSSHLIGCHNVIILVVFWFDLHLSSLIGCQNNSAIVKYCSVIGYHNTIIIVPLWNTVLWLAVKIPFCDRLPWYHNNSAIVKYCSVIGCQNTIIIVLLWFDLFLSSLIGCHNNSPIMAWPIFELSDWLS